VRPKLPVRQLHQAAAGARTPVRIRESTESNPSRAFVKRSPFALRAWIESRSNRRVEQKPSFHRKEARHTPMLLDDRAGIGWSDHSRSAKKEQEQHKTFLD
jgi:hypothetical protein